MTEAAPPHSPGAASPIAAGPARKPKRRMPKGLLRTFAWVGGVISFLSPIGVLGLTPKPAPAATGATPAQAQQPRTVIIHHVIKKVIIEEPAASSGGVSYVSGGGGGGSVVYLPAPSAPVASTGGSGHP